jgi:hypothetical protein
VEHPLSRALNPITQRMDRWAAQMQKVDATPILAIGSRPNDPGAPGLLVLTPNGMSDAQVIAAVRSALEAIEARGGFPAADEKPSGPSQRQNVKDMKTSRTCTPELLTR